MNILLPNGQTLYDLPNDITKKDAASLAIGQGLASLEDFPELFPGGKLPKPEGDDDPTVLENVGGVAADLGIGAQRATKSLVDLAAIPVPEALEPYTTDPLSEFFERGIEATEWLKPEAYKEAQKETAIKRNAEGEFEGFQLPSWQSVAGITAGSLPQIPSFLVGGSAIIKGLKGAKWLKAHPRFAEAIGYGVVNAALVAPGQWRETYKEAIDLGIPEEEAQDAADAASLLTAAVSGATGAAGGAVATRMGVDSRNVGAAMAKGFVAEAPFEGVEEAGQSAAGDIGIGRPVSGVNALESGTMGVLGGGVPGAGIAGMTHFNQNKEAGFVPENIMQREELELRKDRARRRLESRKLLTEAYEQGRGTQEYKEESVSPMEWAERELLAHDIDIKEYSAAIEAADLGDADAKLFLNSLIEDDYITQPEMDEINAVIAGEKNPPLGHDVVSRGALAAVNKTINKIAEIKDFDEGDVKKITKALDVATDQRANDRDRVDALNVLARAAGTDDVIARSLSQAQDILSAVKTQPVKPVTRTPIDMKKYGKFVTNLEKRLKKVGLKEMSVTLRHKLEEVAETHNGDILYGIRPYQSRADDARVAYDKEGRFVYDDTPVNAAGFFEPNIGRIFISIDNHFTEGKTEKEAMDDFMKTMNHEVVHALKSLDLFTNKEWDILLNAAKKNNYKDREYTYYEWAKVSYREDLNIKRTEEEAIAELIGQEAVTGLPRQLINRLKVFIGQLKSALDGTGFTTFESIIQDVSTGKVGKRERGVVRTYREMGEKGIVGEAVFQSDQQLKEQWTVLHDLMSEEMGTNLNLSEMDATGTRYGNLQNLVEEIDNNRFEGLDSQALNNIKGKAVDLINRFKKNAENFGMTEEELASGVSPIMFRRQPTGQEGQGSFQTADPYGRGTQIVHKLQDKLIGLKRIEAAINKARKARGEPLLTARESAYIGEELSHGRIGEVAREFLSNEVEPLVDALSNANIELADLDEFLVLRHAIERNARIRKVNPNLGRAGSGEMGGNELTDDFVKNEMLTRFGMEWVEESGTWRGGNREGRTMQDLASRVDDIVQHTLVEAHNGQLLTDEAFDKLTSFYKYYTPLRGFGKGMLQEIDEESEYGRAGTAGTGGSISILGKHAQKAKGRTSEAFSPTATIIADRERTISRAIKNRDIGNRLFNLVENNPEPDTWEIIGPGHPRYDRQWDNNYTYIGTTTGDYVSGVTKKGKIPEGENPDNWVKQVKGVALENPVNAKAEELIGVKVGGEQYFIDIKDARLRRSLLNLDSAVANPVIQTLGNINRFLSFVNTTLNPEFVIGNFSRDIQTAIGSIINEKHMPGGMLKELSTKKMVREVIGTGGKNLVHAGRVFYRQARGKNLDRQDEEDILEFLNAGAKADWFHSLPVDQQRANLQRMLDVANGTFKGKQTERMQVIKSFVEDGNAAVENAVRFSTFKVAKQKFMDTGMSQEEAVERAASMAKNMTINFNRKGEAGNLLNSMYLFFNAQVQGTAVIVRGLKSPTKQKILGGIVSMGAMMSMLHEMSEDEDDPESKSLADVPDFVRERNMIVPLPGGGNDVKVPLPYGYNFFYQLGSNMYLMARGKMKPGKAAMELGHTFLGSFSPVGSPAGDDPAKMALRLGTPTAFTPIMELATNENYFGQPIYKEQFDVGTPTPDSQRTWKNSNEILKSMMQGINELTGGNVSESGAVDVSPDTISYLIGYGLGGAGAFAERMWMKPAGRLAKSKTPFEEYNDIPFVRRFIHEYTNKPDMEAYYDRRDRINQKTDHYQKLTGDAQQEYIEDNIEFLRFKEVYKQSEKQLRILRQQQKQIDSVIEMYPERAESLSENQQRIEESIDRIIHQVNDMFDDQVEGN
jgi:hypothetical protein